MITIKITYHHHTRPKQIIIIYRPLSSTYSSNTNYNNQKINTIQKFEKNYQIFNIIIKYALFILNIDYYLGILQFDANI